MANKKGGFKRIGGLPAGNKRPMSWIRKACFHPEHNPPGHIVLKPGLYEYTCPGCGRTTLIKVPETQW